MRNSDKVSFVAFSEGGARGNGKVLGTKIRFTNDRTRYTKALNKLGVNSVVWVDLPKPMTKVEAISHLRSLKDSTISTQVYQDAINHAAKRLVPSQKAAKVVTSSN